MQSAKKERPGVTRFRIAQCVQPGKQARAFFLYTDPILWPTLTSHSKMTTARRLLCLAAPLIALTMSASAFSSDLPSFFEPVVGNRFAEISRGVYAARFNAAPMRLMARGEEARLRLGDVIDTTLVLDRLVEHSNGDFSWIGHIKAQGSDFRVAVTQGTQGAIGEIRTPAGRYLISADNRVTSSMEAGLSAHRSCAGERPAPPGDRPLVDEPSNGFAAENVIDVMVLHTPGLSAAAGVSAESAINHLVALANQAYVDSGASLRLRVAHIQSVDYSERGSNDTALDALTDASGPFADVPTLRAAKGADLVTLIRPLDAGTHDSCGVAWLNGAVGAPMNAEAAYSVVSYGTNNGQICDSYTLAHELGHNMGSTHDFANAGSQGAFPYSYGYGLQGVFGTIMSYIDPIVGRFSSPGIDCVAGRRCGTSGADNVRSLNNTAPVVAAFLSGGTTPALTAITVVPASIVIGGTATIEPVPGTASLGTCTSSSTTIASVSGNRVTGVAAGTATVSCGSATAPVSVTKDVPQQNFSLTASASVNGAGSVALTVTLKPNGADIGKTANIYVAALVDWNGSPRWFVFNGNTWVDSTQAGFPAAYRRTLRETEPDLPVLNNEISEVALRSLHADIYVGYEPDGGSDLSPLVYGVAQSFR